MVCSAAVHISFLSNGKMNYLLHLEEDNLLIFTYFFKLEFYFTFFYSFLFLAIFFIII